MYTKYMKQDASITKRQRLLNEMVTDLVATRTSIVLVMRFNNIMKSKDLPLIMAAHKAVGSRVVDAVMKANEAQDPQCPLYEHMQSESDFERNLEHIVHLCEAGCQPQ